jgi:5-methyltetrahydrofolate--homocysteine methyltransferase
LQQKVSSLLDDRVKADFIADIDEEYEDLRAEHYESLKDRRYLSLEAARAKRLKVNFALEPPAPAPRVQGIQVLDNYDLELLIPYIDWNPFFQTWQLRGKYPNRGYPKIFQDETVGAEAKKLFDEAQAALQNIVKSKSIRARGVFAILPANAVGDDIELYKDAASRDTPVTTFYGLRQQAEKVTFFFFLSFFCG